MRRRKTTTLIATASGSGKRFSASAARASAAQPVKATAPRNQNVRKTPRRKVTFFCVAIRIVVQRAKKSGPLRLGQSPPGAISAASRPARPEYGKDAVYVNESFCRLSAYACDLRSSGPRPKPRGKHAVGARWIPIHVWLPCASAGLVLAGYRAANPPCPQLRDPPGLAARRTRRPGSGVLPGGNRERLGCACQYRAQTCRRFPRRVEPGIRGRYVPRPGGSGPRTWRRAPEARRLPEHSARVSPPRLRGVRSARSPPSPEPAPHP